MLLPQRSCAELLSVVYDCTGCLDPCLACGIPDHPSSLGVALCSSCCGAGSLSGPRAFLHSFGRMPPIQGILPAFLLRGLVATAYLSGVLSVWLGD